MAKKKKFNLSAIKVESFVTSLKDEEKEKVKAGEWIPDPSFFPCTPFGCL
jgi:hypothetical protein